MNYSSNEADCEVNFFKESGKWMYTESINFDEYYDKMNYPRDFKKFLESKLDGRHKGLIAVCINTYNSDEYPIMCKL